MCETVPNGGVLTSSLSLTSLGTCHQNRVPLFHPHGKFEDVKFWDFVCALVFYFVCLHAEMDFNLVGSGGKK